MDDISILRIVATDPDAFIAFAGEVMLNKKREGIRWQVTFDLAMDTDAHPFNRYHGKATSKPGTRFMAMLVEVNDQDEPVNQTHKAAVKAQSMGNPVGKALVKESGMMRRDVYFTRFLWWKLDHMEAEEKEMLVSEMPHGLFAEIDESGGKVLAEPKDRKSTRLNSSHQIISYAVFCLKKKKNNK